MKSIEILTNRLASLRDSYQHYTMVDKDKYKAFWIKNDIEEVEILLNELSELKRLKDLEKELGCPLKVLIRGFIDSNKLNDDLDYKQKIMVYNCNGKLIEGFEMELSGGEYIDIAVDGEDNNNDYDIETITVKIKDYGKTWWLKGEK